MRSIAKMIAAGVRKFAGGLGPARTLRARPNGELLLTDGPYLETKEHVGGLWILECADMDEAVAWARKGAKACRSAIERRKIFFMPAPKRTERHGSSQLARRSYGFGSSGGWATRPSQCSCRNITS